jgi:S1-C subfamily serine protease
MQGVFADSLEVQDGDYEKAIKQVKNSVFRIAGPRGHGSGFLLADGYILTNRHVVQDNDYDLETTPTVIPFPFQNVPLLPLNISAVNDPNYEISTFVADDRTPPMKFRAVPVHLGNGSRALHKDMALLQVPPDVRSKLPPMKPVTPVAPSVGRPVLVMGNPSDLTGHITSGRVSKSLMLDKGENPLWKDVPFVGTDAAINGGNSGGPMFSLRKERLNGRAELKTELIGMSTYGYRGSAGMGGGIRGDYISYIATKLWGLNLMTQEQMNAYEKEFPNVK